MECFNRTLIFSGCSYPILWPSVEVQELQKRRSCPVRDLIEGSHLNRGCSFCIHQKRSQISPKSKKIKSNLASGRICVSKFYSNKDENCIWVCLLAVEASVLCFFQTQNSGVIQKAVRSDRFISLLLWSLKTRPHPPFSYLWSKMGQRSRETLPYEF